MKLLVTGGTGFLGSEVVPRLVKAGHQVHVLTRDAAKFRVPGAEAIGGDIQNLATWEECLRGFEGCVHMVGILRENRGQGQTFERMHYQATVDLLRVCGKMGLTRFVFISANGVEKGLNIPYMRTKAIAEQAVRSSNLNWTILRPSVIYGGDPGHLNFVDTLKRNLDRSAWFPYFGDGSYRIAPISAREVAWTIVHCLKDPQTQGKVYHLCGSETYTYKALLLLTNQAGNYRCSFFSIPMWLMTQVSGLLGGLASFPLTSDMLRMLAEGNDCPAGCLTQRELGVTSLSFKDWLMTGILPEFPQAIPLPGATPTSPEPPAPEARQAAATTNLKGAPVTQDLNQGTPITTRPLTPDDPVLP